MVQKKNKSIFSQITNTCLSNTSRKKKYKGSLMDINQFWCYYILILKKVILSVI